MIRTLACALLLVVGSSVEAKVSPDADSSSTAEPPVMVDTGSPPRRPIALTGARRAARIIVDTSAVMGGMFVAMSIEFTARPSAIASEWQLVGEALTLKDTRRVPAADLAKMNKKLSFAREITGRMRVSRSARFSDIRFALSTLVDDPVEREARLMVEQALSMVAEALPMPGEMLPAAAVGLRASWRSTSTVTKRNDKGAATAASRCELRLARQSGSVTELTLAGTTEVPPTRLGADTISMDGKAEGTARIDSSLALPAELALKMTMNTLINEQRGSMTASVLWRVAATERSQ
jgi:hypothetical protein